jgi:hypothetical protein
MLGLTMAGIGVSATVPHRRAAMGGVELDSKLPRPRRLHCRVRLHNGRVGGDLATSSLADDEISPLTLFPVTVGVIGGVG